MGLFSIVDSGFSSRSAKDGKAMDIFRFQFRRVQEQLAGLSPSQKMLSGALLVIMVMTMYWWMLYAGRSEMVAVLEQGIGPGDVSAISARLRGMGVSHRLDGDRILVPADRRDEVLADLAYTQMLPQDTRSAFDEMIAKVSPFHGSRMKDAMANEARQVTLAGIIRRFPRVSHAAVLIDSRHERGPRAIEPRATVFMNLRPGASSDPKLVNAAADLVAGAVANLKRSNIKVIIGDTSHAVRDREADGGNSDDYLASVQNAERYYHAKISEQLKFIDGAMIAVSVRPNIERRETIDRKVDPKNVIQQVVSEESTIDESHTSQAAGEAGMISNGRMAVDDVPAPEATRSSTEGTRAQFFVDAGHTNTRTVNPGGDLTVTACSVLIPRSHFVQDYRHRTNTTADPDPAVLDPFIAAESQRLRNSVRLALGLVPEEMVHVDAYTDLMPAAGTAPPLMAGAAGSLALGNHVKEIALGALALISLLMVAGMVRKGAPAPAVVAQAAQRQPVALPGGENAIGEASEGLATLDAMEVDEESMRAGQMVTQVSQLVGENPDAAANLVKRWLIRS
jgi:flagellar biosynthesis/type III secretory pathway M-ring protein FliF/YscJ